MAARDMVMHAHIWVARTADGRFVERPVLRPGYGDPKFDRVLDPDTRKSRLLSLNLFPTRVWRRDAYLAIKSMVATLRALESIEGLDPTGFRIEGNTESYDFKGGFLTLPQIADALVIPNDGG